MTLDSAIPTEWQWNELEMDAAFYRGLILVMAFGRNGEPVPVGTGFIVKSDGGKATAMTAAHVLAEVRRMQTGNPRHSRTALEMFLPSPKEVDIDRMKLQAFIWNGQGGAEGFPVTGIAFDEGSDMAILTLARAAENAPAIPRYEFAPGDGAPNIGTMLGVLSFGDLGVQDYENNGDERKFSLQIRPVLRVGRVTEIFPAGNRLCKGPCIETSIPVYSGMSGGPVFVWDEAGKIKPIALVCSDPDPDGEQKQDTSQAGASIMALLPTETVAFPGGRQYTKFDFTFYHFAGDLRPAVVQRSYRPAGRQYLSEFASFWSLKIRF